MHYRDLANFLAINPSLKEIEVESLFKYPSELFTDRSSSIEKVHLLICPLTEGNAIGFKHLKNLLSLSLTFTWTEPSPTFVFEPFIREIGGADIPLKHLTLGSIQLSGEDHRLCDEIFKLKHLETLSLRSLQWESVEEFKQLSSKLHILSELQLKIEVGQIVFIKDIKELVRWYSNLQHLEFSHDDELPAYERHEFCSKDFTEIVDIVEHRPKKTSLHIVLTERCFDINISVELMQRYRRILTVTPP